MPTPSLPSTRSETHISEESARKNSARIRRDVDTRLKKQIRNAGEDPWSETDHDIYNGFDPNDQIEQYLIAQMIVTHNHAMACFERASNAMSDKQKCAYMKLGATLNALYVRQVDALNKHRGKGQQTMTVQHLNVQPGGRAIVGNVAHNADIPKSEY